MSKDTKTEATNVNPATMTEFEKIIAQQLQTWERVETGFAPYYKPEVGAGFFAKVCVLDARDPNFIRYVLQCTRMELKCARGPVDGAEEVIVKPGEFFTLGEYASLPLQEFFDIEVAVLCTDQRKLAGNEGSNGKPRKMFEFTVTCSPEDNKKLKARKADEMKLFMARRTMGQDALAATNAQALS